MRRSSPLHGRERIGDFAMYPVVLQPRFRRGAGTSYFSLREGGMTSTCIPGGWMAYAHNPGNVDGLHAHITAKSKSSLLPAPLSPQETNVFGGQLGKLAELIHALMDLALLPAGSPPELANAT